MYNWVGIPLMWTGFRLSTPFIRKVREGIHGRRGWKMLLREWAKSRAEDKPIWMFHAASVGELEAIRPVIQRVIAHGKEQVVLSVFSPSVYDAAQKVPGVDGVFYLPFDTLGNQRFFLDQIHPQLVVITKHDVWPNLLVAAKERGIYTALINANFHPRSFRVHPAFGFFHRWVFLQFDGIAAVAKDHIKRLQPFVDDTVTCQVLGDSRYDRVLERVGKKSKQVDEIRTQLEDRIVIVAGSTHSTEEQQLVPVVADLMNDHPKLFVIWVPHDPEPQALKLLEQMITEHRLVIARWSEDAELSELSGVVVDVTGILADLYSVGDIALVGGGYDKGVHSVIEPAATGLPVLFGPRYHVSQEAGYLIERGGGMVFQNREELEEILRSLLGDEKHRKSIGLNAKSVVEDNVGASERIIKFLDGIVGQEQQNNI